MDTAVGQARNPLTEGQTITFTAARITVTLQCVRPGLAYTVETWQGGALRLAELCSTHTTETAARDAARDVARTVLVLDAISQPAATAA